MKLLKHTSTAIASFALLVSPAHANPTIEAAERLAAVAFQAIEEDGNWNAGVTWLQYAIDASDDECTDGLYQDYLDLTIRARDARAQGASERSTYQWWSNEAAIVDADCYHFEQ